MSSFAEELSKFFQPVGESFDPEDDIFEGKITELVHGIFLTVA